MKILLILLLVVSIGCTTDRQNNKCKVLCVEKGLKHEDSIVAVGGLKCVCSYFYDATDLPDPK